MGREMFGEAGYFASISGMLCRSTTWLEKFSRHNAAVRLARTQFRYGRRVLDYKLVGIDVEGGGWMVGRTISRQGAARLVARMAGQFEICVEGR